MKNTYEVTVFFKPQMWVAKADTAELAQAEVLRKIITEIFVDADIQKIVKEVVRSIEVKLDDKTRKDHTRGLSQKRS